jgi:SHS2 domain-containing protein
MGSAHTANLPEKQGRLELAYRCPGLPYWSGMGRYTVREDIAVADCALEIEGQSLDDLFETAARAVAELMVDPATIAPSLTREIALAAPSLELLLFDFVAELIFLKDSELIVLTDVSARVQASTPCRLEVRAAGGRIDRPRTLLRADPKAPTLHDLGVEPAGEGWRARLVIDI